MIDRSSSTRVIGGHGRFRTGHENVSWPDDTYDIDDTVDRAPGLRPCTLPELTATDGRFDSFERPGTFERRDTSRCSPLVETRRRSKSWRRSDPREDIDTEATAPFDWTSGARSKRTGE